MASTASTIVSGSLCERIIIHNYMLFAFFISGFIYPISCSWAWGGGWLQEKGFQDFAGSAVIHLLGGVCGLVGAYMCGSRIGRFPN
mmetsp:Transcript_1025/g.1864  ORF Transcript_1025/g.1864 Transcript_1025/m.1864 type:complete len:86 (+) Transcript_1025:285-542(+)